MLPVVALLYDLAKKTGLKHSRNGQGPNPVWPSFALVSWTPDDHILITLRAIEQKEKWLRPLAKAEIRSCFSMTEPSPGAGSDPTMLQTTAKKASRGRAFRKDLIAKNREANPAPHPQGKAGGMEALKSRNSGRTKASQKDHDHPGLVQAQNDANSSKGQLAG